MSDPRSSRRSTPRRASSTPRTAARRPSRNQGAATATIDPPEAAEPLAAAQPTPTLAPPEPPALPRRASRGDRRARPSRVPRHRLLLACTAVLAVGLIGVLLLNTIISQGAFRQHELEIDLILTAEEEESLARAVQQAEAPIEVEKRARALGMVPAAAPVFLRLSDGAILGEPVPAPEPTGAISFKDAPGIQPTPKPRLAGTAGDQPEDPATSDGTADPAASPGVDPSTGIDPALDPSTGLEDPAPTTDGEPAPSPSPTSQVNP